MNIDTFGTYALSTPDEPPDKAKNQIARSEKILNLIVYDLARFRTNLTENIRLKNSLSILVIRSLKYLFVSFDLMICL